MEVIVGIISSHGVVETGLISAYLHLFCVTLLLMPEIKSSASSLLSTKGSQWSENGKETSLLPVSLLLIRQNTNALVRVELGEHKDKATGS